MLEKDRCRNVENDCFLCFLFFDYIYIIKFTANYSKEKISFLDVEVIKKGNQLVTDLYIKPTDTQKYPHASSCHVFHSKNSIPYSQAWRLNRVCSENSFFDKRYNDLEIWLKGRGYSDNLVRKQILKARKFSRAELLNNQRKKETEDKLVLNIMYHLFLAQLKVVMTRIHILLTPDKEHSKVLRDVPIIGFRRAKSLKDILVRTKIPELKNKGWCGPCKGPRCETRKHIASTRNFTPSTTKRTYEIRPENLNGRSKNVVHLRSSELVINNALEAQRNLGPSVIIIGVRIVTIVKTGKLNKSHFTLILQMMFIVVRVTGK